MADPITRVALTPTPTCLRRGVPVGLQALVILALASFSGDTFAQTSYIGLGPGLHWDDVERTDEAEPDLGGAEGSEEFESEGIANLQLWYLRSASEGGILWGGGVAWHNNYSLVPPDDEDADDVTRYGHLFQVYGEGNLVVPRILSSLDLLLGARLGMLVMFQSRDLQREIDELSDQGFSLWPSLPRIGAFLAPHVGVLWPLSSRISLRSDFGVQFAKLWLYSGTAEVGGAEIERSAELDITRLQLLVGLQIAF